VTAELGNILPICPAGRKETVRARELPSGQGGLSTFTLRDDKTRSRLVLYLVEVSAMRFHPAGLIVFGAFLALALVGGAWSAVAVARFAVIIFGSATLVEIVVNMVRHRDFRVRSRLLALLGEQGSFASGGRARKQ